MSRSVDAVGVVEGVILGSPLLVENLEGGWDKRLDS